MRPITRAVIAGGVLAGATAVVLVLAALSQFRHECEVCMTFHGRSVCREAAGPTVEDARRTAQENACAFVASGMTETVECSRTPPTRVACDAE